MTFSKEYDIIYLSKVIKQRKKRTNMISIQTGRECSLETITKYLEKQILAGLLPPLSKLPTTRQIAEQFSVSQPLVIKSIRELEKRRLVFSRGRKGLFVSATAAMPEIIEVLIFSFEGTIDNNAFVRRVTSFYDSPLAIGRMNFQIRSVNVPLARKSDEEFKRRILKDEIVKLNQWHCHCAVIVGTEFRKEEIRICSALPFPTLFLGDFQEGDYDDLCYNRLGFATDTYHPLMERMEQTGIRHLTVFLPDNLSGVPYLKEPTEKLRKFCRKTGTRLRICTVREPNTPDREKRALERQTVFKELLKDGVAEREIFCFRFGNHCEEWIDEFRRSGIRIRESFHEILFSDSKELLPHIPGVFQEFVMQEELDRQYEFQISTINSLAAGKLSGFRGNFQTRFSLH